MPVFFCLIKQIPGLFSFLKDPADENHHPNGVFHENGRLFLKRWFFAEQNGPEFLFQHAISGIYETDPFFIAAVIFFYYQRNEIAYIYQY